jgi:ribosome-associated translation inhibitor RaiA
MITIKFKNLEKSELAIEATQERIDYMVEKFPDLKQSKINITLEMENSPLQAGPDFFKIKMHVRRGRYNGITLVKGNSNLYLALAELVDHLLEKLNRFGDKARVKERKSARQLAKKIKQSLVTPDPMPV